MADAIANLGDPVAFLRMGRAILFVFAAIIMFIEPFACGGINRKFHHTLGGVFATAAIYTYLTIQARLSVLMVSPDALAVVGIPLLVGELLFTGVMLGLITKMVYQFYRWRILRQQRLERRGFCWPRLGKEDRRVMG